MLTIKNSYQLLLILGLVLGVVGCLIILIGRKLYDDDDRSRTVSAIFSTSGLTCIAAGIALALGVSDPAISSYLIKIWSKTTDGYLRDIRLVFYMNNYILTLIPGPIVEFTVIPTINCFLTVAGLECCIASMKVLKFSASLALSKSVLPII